MIFRLSQKLAKKIKEAPSQSLPLDSNPFTDWSALHYRNPREAFKSFNVGQPVSKNGDE